MANQNNQENSSNDQADGKFDKAVKNAQGAGGVVSNPDKLSKGVTSDADENSGAAYSKNLMNKPDKEVRENEDASLQDDSYSFDEANTDNEEYHDADGAEDFDLDNDDDFVQ